MIALAKAKPGSLNYGSYGIGTYAHLSMEDFKQKTGTDIVHIPYRGAAPAATALLAGDVAMLLLNLSSIEEYEKTGKVRILPPPARSGRCCARICRRSPRPACPGSRPPPGSRCGARPTWRRSWWRRIDADVAKALELPQSREFFATNSFERVDLSPAQFAQLIQDDFKHWGALVKAVGAKLD